MKPAPQPRRYEDMSEAEQQAARAAMWARVAEILEGAPQELAEAKARREAAEAVRQEQAA